MAASISATLIPCLKSFNQIQEIVEQSQYDYEEDVSSVSWTDELGRLRVWAANIGAHQTGQSSLEYRLRDASHIRRQITKLLKDLDGILNDIKDELSEVYVEALEFVSSSNDEDVRPDDEIFTPEMRQLYEEVVNIVDCLYKMSMLIRRPAQHDVLLGSHKIDAAAFEPYDREHVRNKYPDADDVTIQRLGSAITQRRRYLKYRDRHHAKLGKGIDGVQGIQGTQATVTQSALSETIATDFQTLTTDFEETCSNSGFSQTSYAPSLTDGGLITIPPLPKESAGGKPFECPYCFFPIEINGKRLWTRHIVKDIKPYVCIFPDCRTPDRLFESRREWFFHLTTKHRVHDLICPLCKDSLMSLKQLERHVARHLEELALFALPRSEMDNGSDEDSLDNRASSTASHVVLDSADSGSSEEGYQANDLTAEQAMNESEERDDIGSDQVERSLKRSAQKSVRLKKLVETNIKECNQNGNWASAVVISDVYKESLRDSRTAEMLSAVLSGAATFAQSEEFFTRVTERHKIRFEAGIKPHKTPDVLYLWHKGIVHPLYFPANDILKGRLTVGEVRRQAALATATDDLSRIGLICNGKILEDDHRACNEENLKSKSQIELLITEIGMEEGVQAESAAQIK